VNVEAARAGVVVGVDFGRVENVTHRLRRSNIRGDLLERSDRAELVGRAKSGDQLAWAELHGRSYAGLLAFAYHRLGSVEEARDAVSETMARAVASIDRFVGSDDRFGPWLFGICRHVVGDVCRRRRHFSDEEPADVPEPGLDPSDSFMAGQDQAVMRAAFLRLDPDEQELLRLRVIAGLSSEETGAVLGKKPGTIRVAQMRALRRLRTFVEESDS
jgi:RNA polymerase sigma-70 factor (ECF subfamily)